MIDLKKPYLWDELNESYKNQLQTTASVKVYQSVSHALLELTMAFQLLYSHKKQFYSSLGLGTHADEALLFLARQGTKSLPLTAETPLPLDDKKTLFIISDKDDAITNEIYKLDPAFIEDDKVFRITVSHQHHDFVKPHVQLKDTEILILNLKTHAVALLGKRCQSLQSYVAPTLDWSHLKKSHVQLGYKQENKSWVQSVENEMWAGGEALSGLSANRIYDRAFLAWPKLEATTLRQILITEQGIAEHDLETVNLSRWNETKLIAQFEKRGWSADQFRGTLILSVELAARADFKNKLQNAVQTLIQKSSQ